MSTFILFLFHIVSCIIIVMKRNATLILNLFIGMMSFIAWMGMALLTQDAQLAASGLENLKFFTILSNLFNGVICILYVYWMRKGKSITLAQRTWKLMSTTAVGLTFTTVMVFLGPLYGYGAMFTGANFWLHLVLPVASMISYIFLEEGVYMPFKQTLYGALPTLLYSIGYVSNILLHGKGEWPNTNDFYAFLYWGNGIGAIIATVIFLVSWILACILWKIESYRLR